MAYDDHLECGRVVHEMLIILLSRCEVHGVRLHADVPVPDHTRGYSGIDGLRQLLQVAVRGYDGPLVHPVLDDPKQSGR